MPDVPPPGSTPTGYQRTQGGGVAWSPPDAAHLEELLPQYHIECLIGRGGMGAVYKGTQKSLERPVAIKILPPDLDDADASYTERFKNEAKLMAKMNHPAIVHVYDYGETSEGQFYFVMEFVNGTDVQQMIQAQGRLPPEHALAITAHVCDALKYAHEHGVIHRDIKPANVLINMEGAVKVADFGLAKASDGGTTGITKTGMAMGTPDYVAPEALVMGVDVDARADVYAVGVMLYAMLTGLVPRGAFKPPSVLVKGIDKRFDSIVEKAMQMNRDERYPSAAHIRRDLDIILTAPHVQPGGESSAAIPKAAVAQKPVAKGPQKPMGKSANVPVDGRRVRQNAEDAPGTPDRTLASAPTAKSKTPLLIGIGAAAAIAVGAFVMMGGKKKDNAAASAPPPAAASSSASTTPIKVREEPKTPSGSLVPSTSSSSNAGLSSMQLEPGKWERLAGRISAADLTASGATLKPDGSIKIGNFGVRLTAIHAHDIAVRAKFKRDSDLPYTGVSVRQAGMAFRQINLGEAATVLRTTSDNKRIAQSPEIPHPPDVARSKPVLLEIASIGKRTFGTVDGKLLAIQESDMAADAGGIMLFGTGAEISDLEVMLLDGTDKYPTFVKSALDRASSPAIGEKGNDSRQPAVATSNPKLPDSNPAASSPAPPAAAPAANSDSKSPISNAAPAAFPPGQWVKVFSKLDELPQSVRGNLNEAAWDGWIPSGRLQMPEELNINYGIRARFRVSDAEASNYLILRRDGKAVDYVSLISRGAGLIVQQPTKEGFRGIFTVPAPSGQRATEYSMEFAIIGTRLVARLDSDLLKTATVEVNQRGSGSINASGPVRDIEVINLDGIPEAEALRILGVDEKGNDLRALATKQEQQKAEQAKVVDAMAAIPELKTLHEQFVKLQAERVTAPFEKDVAALNTSYLGGLDRKIAEQKKKGDLDGVLVLEAEKKLIADKQPLPAEDDDTTPATLKDLRKIYRDAHAKLEATRAANLKALTDPLSIRLKQLESTLTQQNRIEHAKTVREYRENLGKVPEAELSPSSNAADSKSDTDDGAASKYTQREVAEWFLSIGAKVVVKANKGSKEVLPGDKLPAGQIIILRLTPARTVGDKWTFGDDDFGRLRGLHDLVELTFANCPNVTGSGLAMMGNLPSLNRLEINWPKIIPANFSSMPVFPKLTELVIDPSYCPAENFEWVLRFKQLSDFFAPGQAVTDAHLAVLAKCPKLTSLRCTFGKLTDDGLAVLEGTRSLEELFIHSNTGVTGTGLVHLRSLPKLRSLNTGGGPFKASNLSLITQMKHVDVLFLAGATVAAEPEEVLTQLSALKNQISELEIGYANDVTADQETAIKKAMPKTKVVFKR